MKKVRAAVMAALAGACALLTTAALAAGGKADWVSSGVGVVEDTTAGLMKLGAQVLGGGVVVVAISLAIMQKFDVKVIAILIAAGILMIFGPDMIYALMGT
ncbi:hypothetical protein [Insolitispirillum peregrinum]|uniref:TrbC/VIRB2 family protein n=1 Tax=Insolitispirillum peregrinum TaxID=80876 RepID=A0A1N7MI26_9PROT|nr:hypothetical protein [Insolitispirillum peregrinum]SIS85569.1 hypothetical protein SAMN05421779_104127 [Insolitispirillum peregrinum]